MQDSEVGHDITDYELHEIATEVERAGKIAEMCEALEKPAANVDARTLLGRWQKEMKSMGAPPRPHLMYHLARMGMKDLHAKSVASYNSSVFLIFQVANLLNFVGCYIKSLCLRSTGKNCKVPRRKLIGNEEN